MSKAPSSSRTSQASLVAVIEKACHQAILFQLSRAQDFKWRSGPFAECVNDFPLLKDTMEYFLKEALVNAVIDKIITSSASEIYSRDKVHQLVNVLSWSEISDMIFIKPGTLSGSEREKALMLPRLMMSFWGNEDNRNYVVKSAIQGMLNDQKKTPFSSVNKVFSRATGSSSSDTEFVIIAQEVLKFVSAKDQKNLRDRFSECPEFKPVVVAFEKAVKKQIAAQDKDIRKEIDKLQKRADFLSACVAAIDHRPEAEPAPRPPKSTRTPR